MGGVTDEVLMFLRTHTIHGHAYLLLVENERVDGKVTQRVLQRFGRMDHLRASGQLDAIVAGLGRFSERLLVLGAPARGETLQSEARRIGGPLVFERLWEASGLAAVVRDVAADRQYGFSLERTVWLTVLHRLLAPGSDRAAERWKDDYVIAGVDRLNLHQLYRAMAWLGQPLTDQSGATPFAPRTTKDRIEEALVARRQDLFTTLDLVFFDTTSISFEGEGGDTVGRYGHSKDHRPDHRQMVVGLAMDADGHPLCCELWPGNATDVKSLVPIVDRLRTRFHIRDVCIVADRGMISQAVIDEIERRDSWNDILGVRMRAVTAMRELLAADEGPYDTVFPRPGDPKCAAPLKVRGVRVDGADYVLCLNEDEATKDRHDRDAIIAALRGALHAGDTALVGNRGYRRYLKSVGHRFEVDEAKITVDARYDGKWVLTTNTGLDARTTALAYKHLWMVEALFRSMKSVLETRPVYHTCDETIRGHVFCSFLALVLRKELEDCLAARHWNLEWDYVVADLDHLEEVTLTVGAKGYVLRTEPKGTVAKVCQAAGVALPPVIRPS